MEKTQRRTIRRIAQFQVVYKVARIVDGPRVFGDKWKPFDGTRRTKDDACETIERLQYEHGGNSKYEYKFSFLHWKLIGRY